MSEESLEDQALDASYRLAARSAGAPAESTRRAILAQARVQAAARGLSLGRARPAPRWARPALFGTLAATVVAGLIMVPRWRPPTEPPAPLASVAAPAAPVEAQIQMKSAADAAPAAPPPALARAPVPVPPLAQSRIEELTSAGARAATSASVAADAARQPTTAIANTTTAHVAAAPLAQAPQLPGAQLRHAAEVGDLAQLEALSRGNPDLNAPDDRGRTALLLATLNGHANAVAALLAYGADARVADAQGVTPLQAARAAGNGEILAIFARYGLH